MSEPEEFVELNQEIPMLSPIQVVGGGVTIGANPNLSTDATIVTLEVVAMVPTDTGPQLGLLPILMETDVWDVILSSLEDNTNNPSEEDTE